MDSGDKNPSNSAQRLRAERQVDVERRRLLGLPGRVAFAKLARMARIEKIFAGNAKALLDHLSRTRWTC